VRILKIYSKIIEELRSEISKEMGTLESSDWMILAEFLPSKSH
tara:strand:- start:555 stop:683 length:129 start_codon:yes stop_codon:yes gene_type:complete